MVVACIGYTINVINLYEKCMFYAAETYAMHVTTLNHLRCYGRAVVHLICNVKENDKASFFSKSLTSKLWMLHFARFGHVECCMERLLKYANCTKEIMHPQRKLGMKYCKIAERNLEWI